MFDRLVEILQRIVDQVRLPGLGLGTEDPDAEVLGPPLHRFVEREPAKNVGADLQVARRGDPRR